MASSKSLSKATTTFSLKLMKTMCDGGETGNTVYSSFSVYSTLAMLLLGARGNTQKQIAQAMESLAEQGDIIQYVGGLQRKFLHFAKRLFGEKTYNFTESFQTECKAIFGAELQPVDFINHAEEARVKINHWVDSETNGKGQDLLGKGSVNKETKMVVVDATFFEGDWEQPFSESDTTTHKFWISKTEWKPVKMMNQSGYFAYEADTHTKMRSWLDHGHFKKRTDSVAMPKTPVKVSLPHFTIEQKLQMKDGLKRMGMVDAFDPAKSDFSGMSQCQDLALSEVFQQVFINVDEAGAAAGTRSVAVTKMACSMEQASTWQSFVADHSFFFYIVHNPSSTALFMGTVISPS
ncbi:leukocyte elastase inhibitor A-like isoform X1 [Synchiropus splendidus]|uniref:leukocyte elastase inhibitor A-like isoform X1 n=1 Tax=Synchiropus splendidus TaxID=270530 RepID=UPI00237ECA71|nr:leukocyte elastase inhibitor A-like isoform X1 [Synchiropus splendidus]